MFDLEELMMMPPEDLEMAPPFSTLFPVKQAVLKTLVENMRANGYDMAQPVVIWPNPGGKPKVVDGRTRVLAATEAGIEVAVFVSDFGKPDDEDAIDRAIEYAVSRQRDRRNLTDAEVLQCLSVLDSRKQKGRKADYEPNQKLASIDANSQEAEKKGSKSAADRAETLGIDTSKVERSRKILKDAPEDIKAAVISGDISIHKAWKETKQREEATKAARQPVAPMIVPKSTTPAPVPIQPNRQDTPVVGKAVTDEEGAFLESIPLRGKLKGDALESPMDDDIRLYRVVEPTLKKLREDTLALLGPTSLSWLGPLHQKVMELTTITHPSLWLPCQACGGDRIQTGKGTCKRCRGRGYRID